MDIIKKKKKKRKIVNIFCPLFLYLFWVLKRTVSLSTFYLPIVWLDAHLYENVLLMSTPFPQPKGVSSGAEGEGVLYLVRIPSALVMGGIGHE